jgi:hypothetical protein
MLSLSRRATIRVEMEQFVFGEGEVFHARN